MPRVLVLKINGARSLETVEKACDYKGLLGGHPELLEHEYNPALRCYVCEDAMMHSLKYNPWSALVRAMGFEFRGILQGDAVLCSGNASGYDRDVAECVVTDCEAYEKSKWQTLVAVSARTRSNKPPRPMLVSCVQTKRRRKIVK